MPRLTHMTWTWIVSIDGT